MPDKKGNILTAILQELGREMEYGNLLIFLVRKFESAMTVELKNCSR